MAWSAVVAGALAATFFSLLLMAIGFSIPFWTSFEQLDPAAATETVQYNVYIGVWYVMVCKVGESGSCASEAFAANFSTSLDPFVFNFVGTEPSDAVAVGSTVLGMSFYAHLSPYLTIYGKYCRKPLVLVETSSLTNKFILKCCTNLPTLNINVLWFILRFFERNKMSHFPVVTPVSRLISSSVVYVRAYQ